MATPRNAPCPCGSGRKHKHCHATAAAAEAEAARAVVDAEPEPEVPAAPVAPDPEPPAPERLRRSPPRWMLIGAGVLLAASVVGILLGRLFSPADGIAGALAVLMVAGAITVARNMPASEARDVSGASIDFGRGGGDRRKGPRNRRERRQEQRKTSSTKGKGATKGKG